MKKMFPTKRQKRIQKELEELVHFEENGGGFGAPEAERSHQRKIELLKHKQILEVEKSNSRLTLINTIVALLNIGVLIYQVFFK